MMGQVRRLAAFLTRLFVTLNLQIFEVYHYLYFACWASHTVISLPSKLSSALAHGQASADVGQKEREREGERGYRYIKSLKTCALEGLLVLIEKYSGI